MKFIRIKKQWDDWKDLITGKTGTKYSLALHIGVEINKKFLFINPAIIIKKTQKGLYWFKSPQIYWRWA